MLGAWVGKTATAWACLVEPHSTHPGSKRTTDTLNQSVIDRAPARAPPPSHSGRAHVRTPRARPPLIWAALPWPPGRMASPPRLRQPQQKSPRKPCQTALNRSMPTCKRTALPEPSASGYFASELARAPGPAAQPSTTAKSAVGRCSCRCPTGLCTSCSSRMSTRSTMLYTRIGSLPTVPSSVRYRSTMATMLQSCFAASVDAQPSTSRSVVRARH